VTRGIKLSKSAPAEEFSKLKDLVSIWGTRARWTDRWPRASAQRSSRRLARATTPGDPILFIVRETAKSKGSSEGAGERAVGKKLSYSALDLIALPLSSG